MKKYICKSEVELKKLAAKLSKEYESGVIGLYGELGAGKTTFVQGFAQGLGIEEKIISPTFVLIRQHPIPKSNKTLYHIDLYRLENNVDIESLGIKELFDDSNNLIFSS